MVWSESVSIGVRGLLLRRLRTLLSTLGIVFGVAAVISMSSIGEGARREAVHQIELLGTNNIRIQRLALTGAKKEEADQKFSAGLTQEDAIALEERLPRLAGLSPVRLLPEEVRYEGRPGNAQVVGVNPVYQEVTNFRVARVGSSRPSTSRTRRASVWWARRLRAISSAFRIRSAGRCGSAARPS